MSSITTVCTIAGSDSSGGAGIQADIKAFTALGAYGCSVLTAITSQNTLRVDGVEGLPASFVAQQLKAVTDDIQVRAFKTGMLYSQEIVSTVASTIRSIYPEARPPLVIDPVMVSSSGHSLLDPSAMDALKNELVPLALIVTPNIPEAKILAGLSDDANVRSLDEVKQACELIGKLGCENVLVKGGHLIEGGKKDEKVFDVLYNVAGQTFVVFEHNAIATKNTHGTGCTLSAALAVMLGKGQPVEEAVKTATDYVQGALQASLQLGGGAGPLNHSFNIIPRALPSPSDANPHPFTDHLISSNATEWKTYTRTHPFILGLRDGTLPRESFIHFLRQDYIFLVHYARIHALAAYKCDTIDEIEATTDIVKHIAREARKHIEKCKAWGISEDEFHTTPESEHTVAYTRYVADVGHSKSLLHLRVAVAPCLLGYGEVGSWLYNDPGTKREGNPYWFWIEEYAGEEFQEAVTLGRDLLEGIVQASPLSAVGLKELTDIFGKATRLECGFWTMGWTRS